MNAIQLSGLRGHDPLSFLAALGVLEIIADRDEDGRNDLRLWWDATALHAMLRTRMTLDQVAEAVAEDARLAKNEPILGFYYPKVEKNGAKRFAGLTPPTAVLRAFLKGRLASQDLRSLRLAAGLMTDAVSEPIPANAQPSREDFAVINCEIDTTGDTDLRVCQTAFDFTSRNAQFLDQARLIAQSVAYDLALAALDGTSDTSWPAERTLGWDTAADLPGALYSYSRPVNPTLEWLAFRALGFFPVVPTASAVSTTACKGRRKNGSFAWPLWSVPAGIATVGGLVSHPQMWRDDRRARSVLGVAHVFETSLTKGADGYSGVFSPSRAI